MWTTSGRSTIVSRAATTNLRSGPVDGGIACKRARCFADGLQPQGQRLRHRVRVPMQRIPLQRAILVDQQIGDSGTECDDQGYRDQRDETCKIDALDLGPRQAVERQLDSVGRRRGGGRRGVGSSHWQQHLPAMRGATYYRQAYKSFSRLASKRHRKVRTVK